MLFIENMPLWGQLRRPHHHPHAFDRHDADRGATVDHGPFGDNIDALAIDQGRS